MDIIEVNDLTELKAVLINDYGKFDTVLDLGTGIRPFNLVPSMRITCVEPYAEYQKIPQPKF